MGTDPIDVAIVGAGPVGATVAALCARDGLAIEVFEARGKPTDDARTLALSHASREMLDSVRAWPATGTTPIDSIHISQKGGPGRTLLEAAEQGLPALGYTVSFAALNASLAKRLGEVGVPIRYGESCEDITLDAQAARLRFGSGREVAARLLVLADGGANVSRIPGIVFREKDYEQRAVVGKVTADRPHGGRAYERFTPQGPVALLPVGGQFALVYTASPKEAERLLALDDGAFLSELQSHFGDRAGRFTSVAARASFPLKLRAINTPVASHTVIVGNAAQSLHPIAGQGLNLGLRDAASLAAVIESCTAAQIGSDGMLEAYRVSRARDTSRGVAFTDLLASVFGDSRRLPTWGRGLALTVLDIFPPARRALAERMIHGASR
jgi:2-octaprenyl-6-methoxyphenol hydroxylase